MADSTDALRDHLARVLDWEDAHVSLDAAVDAMPAEARGLRPSGIEYSAWQLVEHIRLAQEDILDFCRSPDYEHRMAWPEDYWPKDPAPASDTAWDESLASYRRSRDELKRLAREVPDLLAAVPTGKGTQTYLRAILLTADHTAYHVGQLVAVRKALGAWKSP